MSRKISSSSQGKKYKLKTHLYPVLFTTDNHIEKNVKIKNKKCTRTHTHTYLQLVSYFWEIKKKCKQDHRTTIYKRGLEWPRSLNPLTEPPQQLVNGREMGIMASTRGLEVHGAALFDPNSKPATITTTSVSPFVQRGGSSFIKQSH